MSISSSGCFLSVGTGWLLSLHRTPRAGRARAAEPSRSIDPIMAKRPRGSRHRRHHPSGSSSAFEDLVQRALDSIPEPFARALDEVAIVIEPEPTRQQLPASGL